MRLKILLFVTSLSFAIAARAQNSTTGFPSYGSFGFNGFDGVNLSNLNVNFSIPIVSSPGRGIGLSHAVVYDSLIWQKNGNAWSPVADAYGNLTFGWKTTQVAGSIPFVFTTWMCSDINTGNPVVVDEWNEYSYVDTQGTSHIFPVDVVRQIGGDCGLSSGPTGYAVDASGYYIDATLPQTPIVYGRGGVKINSSGAMNDRNGNKITPVVVNSTETDWTDSAGRTALKIVTGSSSIQYKFLDPTGAYQTTTLNLQNLSVKTNFGCSGVVEYTGTASVPQSIVFPNNQQYSFTYESYVQNSTTYYTGRLQRVTLPTGGYYEYDYTGSNGGLNCADGTTLSMNKVVSDGTNSATWSYVRNTSNLTTTVTTPKLVDTPNANDTVISFNSAGHETSRTVFQDSPGTIVLRTINTTWAANGTPATRTTVLEANTVESEIDTTYDSNGLLDSVAEYDWGTGTRGSLLRTTTLTYQTSTNYTSRNILDLVTSKQIKDGSGVVQYRQDVTYDGVALLSSNCETGAAQHDDAGYPCTFNYRGNPTQIKTYLAPATQGNPITKNFTFDWFGNVITAQLNCCQNKTWAYSAATQYSQPDSVVSGTSPTLTISNTYNQYTGLLLTSTDPNNLKTTATYDFLRRPLTISQANGSTGGASISYAYDDTHFTSTTKATIDSTKSVQQITTLDTVGRPVLSTTEDASNNIVSKVSALYDLVGRTYQSSNPYTGSTTSYWSTTQFDVLGRPTSVTRPSPDSSVTTYSYATTTTTVTDPTGKQRKSQSDAVGRLSSVWEPDPTTNNSLTLQTSYTYNVLNQLAQVTQGVQTRTYVHDAFGRLLSATTPEAGRVCFGSVTGSTCNADGYDSFDNLLKRTDARGVLTTYGYDGLNRLNSVSYNVSGATGVPATPTVSLTYGLDSSCTSAHGAGCIGLRITMTDGVGSENYTYNSLEQMTQLQKVIGTAAYPTSYVYNLAGKLTQITYPSGRAVQQSVDAIGRLCEIATSTTGCGTASSPYATGYGYNAAQQVTGFSYGNGVTASLSYSADRLQLASLTYHTSGGSNLFQLNYGYTQNGGNNGQITSVANPGESGQSVNYTYDALGRLGTALSVGSSGYPQWGLSWTYDRYGNRTDQNHTAGNPPTNHLLIDAATNRISGDCYDANGNLLAESAPPCPSPTYTYDAENRMVSYLSAAYTYDGSGLRVKRISGSTTTVYVFSGSRVIAEYDNGAPVSSPSREYVVSGGATIAKIEAGATTYIHTDHLSQRFSTDSNQNYSAHLGQYPFGEIWYDNGAVTTKNKFTTYERDSESGNDYAMARYYVNRLGRFSSPDRLSGSIANPQSLNHYTYVTNYPIGLLDPIGLGSDPTLVCILGLSDNCAGPSGGGGGGGSCTLNDEETACSLVAGVLQSGAGAICPNNDCNGVTLGGDGKFYIEMQVIISLSFSRPTYCDDTGCIGTTLESMGWQGLMNVPIATASDGMPFFGMPFFAFAAPPYFNPKGMRPPYPPNEGPTFQKPPINPTDPPPQLQWIDEKWREILGLIAKGTFERTEVSPFIFLNPCESGAMPQLGPGGISCPQMY